MIKEQEIRFTTKLDKLIGIMPKPIRSLTSTLAGIVALSSASCTEERFTSKENYTPTVSHSVVHRSSTSSIDHERVESQHSSKEVTPSLIRPANIEQQESRGENRIFIHNLYEVREKAPELLKSLQNITVAVTNMNDSVFKMLYARDDEVNSHFFNKDEARELSDFQKLVVDKATEIVSSHDILMRKINSSYSGSAPYKFEEFIQTIIPDLEAIHKGIGEYDHLLKSGPDKA